MNSESGPDYRQVEDLPSMALIGYAVVALTAGVVGFLVGLVVCRWVVS